jgi:HK97 family phage portal protein
MSFFEKRTSLENPQVPLSFPSEWLLDIFSGGRTDSGIRVSEMVALQLSTVFACVNIISDGVSSLPLHVYERVQMGERIAKKVAPEHPLYDLLRHSPNPEMTSSTFFKTMMVHACLWGNAYAELQRNNGAKVVGIWPRNPARTKPIRLLSPLNIEGDVLPPGTECFETTDLLMDSSTAMVPENPELTIAGRRRLVLAEDMLHVPGLSLDGRLGQGVVWLTRQAIGLGLATEKHAAKYFGNGASPQGILTLPGKLEEKAIENLRRSWMEAHGGENAHRTAVLEEGVTYTKIAETPNEGQMLETRKFQREEVAAIFGVPQHMVASSDKMGKSNVEQSSIEFVQYCLHPWLNRWEQELKRKLFSSKRDRNFFAKFDVRKLMYPDAAARAQFYTAGRQWSFLSANDIRELEDMNPLDPKVGEMIMMPSNMQDAGDPQRLGAAAQADLEMKVAAAKGNNVNQTN